MLYLVMSYISLDLLCDGEDVSLLIEVASSTEELNVTNLDSYASVLTSFTLFLWCTRHVRLIPVLRSVE